jgi:hypothetical protein
VGISLGKAFEVISTGRGHSPSLLDEGTKKKMMAMTSIIVQSSTARDQH